MTSTSDYTAEIEAVVDAKLAELATIPVGPLTGRRLELAGDEANIAAYVRRAMICIGQSLGLHLLKATPAVVLEQLCVVSAAKDHDTAGLLKSLINSFLVAYVTPETCDRAFAHLEGLEALRAEVSEARRKRATTNLATIFAGSPAPTKH